MAIKIRDLFIKLGFQVDGTPLAQIDDKVDGFKANLSDSKAKIKEFGSELSNLGRNMTAFMTVPILGAGVASVKLASDIELLEKSFTRLLGSEEAATAKLEELRQLAKETPLQFDQLAESAKRLLGGGVAPDELLGTLKMLGDIAEGDAVKMSRLSAQFLQIKAKGKPELEDLKTIADTGIPIFDQLAKTMGVARGEVFKLSSQGKLKFEDINQTLINMTSSGGMFADAMKEASETTQGRWSNFIGNLKELGIAFGEILLPYASEAVEYLDKFVTWLKDLPAPAKNTILVILGIVAALGPLLLIIGTLINTTLTLHTLFTTFPAVAATMKGAMSVIGTSINGATHAIMSPAGLLAALIAVFFWVDKLNGQSLKQDLFQAFEDVVDVAKNIGYYTEQGLFNPFKNTEQKLGMVPIVGMYQMSKEKQAREAAGKTEVKINNNLTFPPGTSEAHKSMVKQYADSEINKDFDKKLRSIMSNTPGK